MASASTMSPTRSPAPATIATRMIRSWDGPASGRMTWATPEGSQEFSRCLGRRLAGDVGLPRARTLRDFARRRLGHVPKYRALEAHQLAERPRLERAAS